MPAPLGEPLLAKVQLVMLRLVGEPVELSLLIAPPLPGQLLLKNTQLETLVVVNVLIKAFPA
jgi:hypothetical protein